MESVEQVVSHQLVAVECAHCSVQIGRPAWVDQWIDNGTVFGGMSRGVFLQISLNPSRVVDMLVKYPLGSVLRSVEDPDDYGIMLRAEVLGGREFLWTSTSLTGPMTKRDPSSVTVYSYVDGYCPKVMLAMMQPNMGES